MLLLELQFWQHRIICLSLLYYYVEAYVLIALVVGASAGTVGGGAAPK